MDILAEGPIPLAEACKLFPGKGGAEHAHRLTVFGWVKKGRGGVRLEAVFANGMWLTSRAAVGRFVAATTAGHLPGGAPDRTPAQAKRANEAAKQRLVAAGW